MLLSVLVELTWSLVQPYRASLSRSFIVKVAIGVVVVACIVWPFTGASGLHVPAEWELPLRIQQTSAILRILFFLGLAAMSQLLAIGWRNRELQIATGLGFYSLISLGATMLHMHHESAKLFHSIDSMVGASYVCSLIYWVLSFTQQEAPRQEFTPRMQNLLLTVAGTARAARMDLETLKEDGKSKR
jgi:xanthine/uracil permease